MINVSKEQLSAVEYLLDQSSKGNHILFDSNLVREVFSRPSLPMTDEEAYQVEHHIERLIGLDGIGKKKAYVEALGAEELCRVIKTYFNIVENNLFETQTTRH
jgi:endonuclease III